MIGTHAVTNQPSRGQQRGGVQLKGPYVKSSFPSKNGKAQAFPLIGTAKGTGERTAQAKSLPNPGNKKFSSKPVTRPGPKKPFSPTKSAGRRGKNPPTILSSYSSTKPPNPSAKKGAAKLSSNRPLKGLSPRPSQHPSAKKPLSRPIAYSRMKSPSKSGPHVTSKKPLPRPAARPVTKAHSSKNRVDKPVTRVARPVYGLKTKQSSHLNVGHGKMPNLKQKSQTTPQRPSRNASPKNAKPGGKGRRH